MRRLGQWTKDRWGRLRLPARLWWTGLGAVGLAAVLVLVATTVSDASSHPAPRTAASSKVTASGSKSMAGMAMGGAGTGSSVPAGAAPAASTTVCGNVKGATTMADGMVMAPVPSGNPTASQQAAANHLVAETTATPAKYTSLSPGPPAKVHQPPRPHGRRVHAGHEPRRVPGPLRQLGDRQDGRVRPVQARLLDVRQHGGRPEAHGRHVPWAGTVHTRSRRRRPAHPVARARRPLPLGREGRREDIDLRYVCRWRAQHQHVLHAARLDRVAPGLDAPIPA